MIVVNFENADKNLCVICDEPTITGRITCDYHCHEKFVQFCEGQYGISKKVIDETTGISYKVPTRVLIEKGLAWGDLHNYPQLEENEII